MSEKHAQPDEELRRQSYWRLLKYARPYWRRLTIGIAAGLLVGGSLFVSISMIPRLIGVVDTGGQIVSGSSTIRNQAEQLVKALDVPGLSEAEKLAAAERVLTPEEDADPQLTKLLAQARSTISSLHLPCELRGRTIYLYWPCQWQFEVVSADGRVAWQVFTLYTLVFILAWLVKNVAHYINGYCTRYVGAAVVADMREEIFGHLTRQSLSFYGRLDVGHLISRCTNDTSALENAVSHAIEDLTCAPMQIIACFIAILYACHQYHSYTLALILVLGVPALILPLHLLSRKIRKIYKKSFARIALVFTRMHEVFSGIRVVVACNSEAVERQRFRDCNRSYLRQVIRAIRLQMLVSPTMEFIAVTATLIFLVCSYADGVSITQLSALLAPAMMAYRPIKDISKVVALIQQSMAAADRYFALLDTHTELPEKAGARELVSFEHSIRLERISFSYGDKNIIDDISLEIPRGSMIAVVGETGSGKTTIANLIARFYDVTGGRITIDGVDIRDYTIASLRRNIGVVTQDPVLFNESIADNIAYGNGDASQAEIEQAAKLASAHEFIVSGRHPEGYETVVGEKGFKLSGGEKQRVAIARAVLRNPPILILDEATSALDTVTEKLVQDALNRVMSNRTVFAIVHRLSTIKSADMILVMDSGRIIEQGTHEELLALNGCYRKLHDTQFKQ